MPSCDTCSLLSVPENADHAKHYRICNWPEPIMPTNVLHMERIAIAERGSARWVTVKMVTERKDLLHDCPCWKA